MDIDRSWIWGGAGLVIGLLVGVAIGGDGREAREAARRGQAEMERDVAAVAEAIERIDASMVDLGGRVSGIEAMVAKESEQRAGSVEGLRRRLDEVGAGLDGAVAELGGAVSEVGTSVTASLAERLEGLRTALDAVGARGAGRSGAAAPQAGAGSGEPVAIGAAVALGDGAARVFLSGVDRDAGTARVAINGPSPSLVTLGEPVEVGVCTVTLTGFTETGATFEGDCGGGQQAAEAGGGEARAPVEGSGEGTVVAIGSAAEIADGLRVFLSRVDAEAGVANVAVNGPRTVALAMGQPVEAGGCTVTLTGIGEGEATIDGAC
jgi:hypothetical protein